MAGRQVCIVVLSAGGAAVGDAAATGAIVDAWLSKPVRNEDLRAVLGIAARHAA
jgi:hypothetical protein